MKVAAVSHRNDSADVGFCRLEGAGHVPLECAAGSAETAHSAEQQCIALQQGLQGSARADPSPGNEEGVGWRHERSRSFSLMSGRRCREGEHSRDEGSSQEVATCQEEVVCQDGRCGMAEEEEKMEEEEVVEEEDGEDEGLVRVPVLPFAGVRLLLVDTKTRYRRSAPRREQMRNSE